jgi:hypothetical protein
VTNGGFWVNLFLYIERRKQLGRAQKLPSFLHFLERKKMFKYDSDEKIYSLVQAFEAATVSRDDWKHAEHLVVALYYVSRFDLEAAIEKMRSGVLNLLANGFGVDLTKEMPYHETLTVFWMRTVSDFLSSRTGAFLPDTTKELVEKFDKDYPLRFYTRERLFSEEARAVYVEPCKRPSQPADTRCRNYKEST